MTRTARTPRTARTLGTARTAGTRASSPQVKSRKTRRGQQERCGQRERSGQCGQSERFNRLLSEPPAAVAALGNTGTLFVPEPGGLSNVTSNVIRNQTASVTTKVTNANVQPPATAGGSDMIEHQRCFA